jgi:geranylgeranyl pyrophosphate synthase
MESSGAIRYAEQAAEREVQLALEQLEALPDGEAKTHFIALAEMLQTRKA